MKGLNPGYLLKSSLLYLNSKLLQLKIATMCSYPMEACLEFIPFNQILSINLRHTAYPMVGHLFKVGGNLGTPKTFFSVNGRIMLLDLENLVGFLYHLVVELNYYFSKFFKIAVKIIFVLFSYYLIVIK